MKPLSGSLVPSLFLSARFVRFYGRKTDRVVFVARAAGTQLLFAPRKIFTQLFCRTRFALRFSLFRLLARSALPGQERLLWGFVLIFIHRRCHKRISRLSIVALSFFRKVW